MNHGDVAVLEADSQPSWARCGVYEASITSSACSSQASVFSDSSSAQTSISSRLSDDFLSTQELNAGSASSQSCIQSLAERLPALPCPPKATRTVGLTYADITSSSLGQRQHPRRSSLARNQKPPPLVRQCERKINFVDNLVDSATQMVEVIWPVSAAHCSSQSGPGGGVLPLRRYIEETLKRSRTSYSTLQVALYYLVLIKSSVPTIVSCSDQRLDCSADRVLLCGRRMFLAALILASKYLQDRNYSTKAWSRMSGLKPDEINTNERAFLAKVNWKLHIPEPLFKRWTDVVLRYTPTMPPPSPPGNDLSDPRPSWRKIVLELTPELDQIPLPASNQVVGLRCPANFGFSTPNTPTPKRATTPAGMESTSHTATPTPLDIPPRFLEPKPDLAPPTPCLAPLMTPSSLASSTPAVSAFGGSRRPSICSAMSVAQKVGFNRCATDQYPGQSIYQPSRRPSITSAASSVSSPESMISERSRSSRASSISSVTTVSTTSSLAPNRALARWATCRNIRLPPPIDIEEDKENAEGTAAKPIVIADDVDMTSSPEVIDFTINDKILQTPHRHSKHATHMRPPSRSSDGKNRKRCRSHSHRRSDLQNEIRFQLEENMMEIDLDDEVVCLSPAAGYATRMLAKQAQPTALLPVTESYRMPVQKGDGKKRTCCSTSAVSLSRSAEASYVSLV